MQSKTSSVMHSKRLSASSSVDVLNPVISSSTKIEQFDDMKIDQSMEFHNKTFDDKESLTLNVSKFQIMEEPNEVTQIETLMEMNQSVDYNDSHSNWVQAHNLLNRRESRYRRKLDSDTVEKDEDGKATKKNSSSSLDQQLKVGRYLNQATTLSQKPVCGFEQKSGSVNSHKSLKISFSKVKLHGENSTLGSMEKARNSLDTSSKRVIKLRRTKMMIDKSPKQQ